MGIIQSEAFMVCVRQCPAMMQYLVNEIEHK
jgi:hypothetical protein